MFFNLGFSEEKKVPVHDDKKGTYIIVDEVSSTDTDISRKSREEIEIDVLKKNNLARKKARQKKTSIVTVTPPVIAGSSTTEKKGGVQSSKSNLAIEVKAVKLKKATPKSGKILIDEPTQ